ncbi:uncharacterized protein LOC108904902 [Anoplophora glabripennis]|uniref:uncharacterized protein LOC108904902 n=1 Tax=Anoplophora glabripennis TaxID=217634 RepID=UPI000873A5BC|nr:uncharacterized protein LOC108904902 [Anoplophora glabripennis]
MSFYTFLAFFAFLAIASAAEVLQGPSSRTTLVGPEGSVISSVAPGGQVVSEQLPGAAVYSGPVVAPAVAYAAPGLVARSIYGAPLVVG